MLFDKKFLSEKRERGREGRIGETGGGVGILLNK